MRQQKCSLVPSHLRTLGLSGWSRDSTEIRRPQGFAWRTARSAENSLMIPKVSAVSAGNSLMIPKAPVLGESLMILKAPSLPKTLPQDRGVAQ